MAWVKVRLPERMTRDPKALRGWIKRAFEGAARLPPKAARPAAKRPAQKPAQKPAKKRP